MTQACVHKAAANYDTLNSGYSNVLKMNYKGQTTVLSAVFVLVGMMFLVPAITEKALAKASAMTLSLGVSPFGGKIGSAGTLHTQLYGVLRSEGLGIGGATIHITGTGEGKQFTLTTNEFGGYSTFADLAPGTHAIQAYSPGDATHTSASATETITVTS
jgi:hypothetical protein